MLTASEIKQLIEKGEGVRIEFKEAQKGVPDSFYDTVASFLNKEGGIILLGLSDDGVVLGIENANLTHFKQAIVTALNNPEVMNPPYALPVRDTKYGTHNLLYVRVPVSSLVHKHAGVIFDRENDSDFRITDERQISEIYFGKGRILLKPKFFLS